MTQLLSASYVQMKMILVLFWTSLQPWRDRSYLNLNVSKTKDVIVGLGASPLVMVPQGLGLIVWTIRWALIPTQKRSAKKSQQHLFCLRNMAKFDVDRTMMFYKPCIQSVWHFAMICCYGNLSVKAKAALQNCEGQWQNHRCPAKQPRRPVRQICFSKGELHPVSQYSPLRSLF